MSHTVLRPDAKIYTLLTSMLLAAACTSLPTGPSVMALPGTNQSMERFQSDDVYCRHYAQTSIGGTTEGFATESGARSAAIGAVVGAVAGAAIGGSRGAGTGAGIGLLGGSLSGSERAGASQRGTQKRYDTAYVQCMYAKGHKVPVRTQFTQRKDKVDQQPTLLPPPPPGNPPSSPPASN